MKIGTLTRVGLEALFSPDSSQEIKFRDAFRIAAYLATTGKERLSIYNAVKCLYDYRSGIVHGDSKHFMKLQKKSSIVEVAEQTGSYLRQALLKSLSDPQSLDPVSLELLLLQSSPHTKEE
jgi:hypothetical protein